MTADLITKCQLRSCLLHSSERWREISFSRVDRSSNIFGTVAGATQMNKSTSMIN